MILELIDASDDPAEILRTVSDHFRAQGFASTTYVRLAHNASLTAVHSAVDVPPEYTEFIIEAGLGAHDPVPGIAIESGRPVGYYQVEQTAQLSSKNREFFKAMHASGLSEAIVFPATGTGGRTAIIIARTAPGQDLAAVALPELHGVVRAAQARIAQLEKEAVPRASPLSPKECDVLQWIAAGKSNQDIGTILDISTNTVATHTKRIFAKLHVSDRVAAALVGVRLGYVSLDLPAAIDPPAEDLAGNLLCVR